MNPEDEQLEEDNEEEFSVKEDLLEDDPGLNEDARDLALDIDDQDELK